VTFMSKTILDNPKSLYCSLCERHCRFNCLSIFEEEKYDEICEWVKFNKPDSIVCKKTVKEIVDNLEYRNGSILSINEMW
jgi:MinD superfamily P-loop ATPase